MRKLLYIIFIAFVSCSAETDNSYRISGNIENLKSNLLYSKIVNERPQTIDTIEVVNGKFDFEAQDLFEDDFRFLIPMDDKTKFIKIFSDNSDLSITGNIDSLSYLSISGSKSHDLFDKLMNEYTEIDTETKRIGMKLQVARMDEDGVLQTELEEKLYANEDRKPELFINFAKSNPDSNVSAWALLQIINFADYNELKPVYDLFSDRIKKTTYSESLNIILSEMGKTTVGVVSPKFTLLNVKGENVNLIDFRGKYVLIDFWSPMCSYCRLENPHLVEVYSKYKNKGFEIVGVNVEGDVDLDIWELVIEEDNMQWIQLRDTIGVADIYKIKNTPSNLLIDKDGVIVAKDIHQGDLDKKLKELFDK